MKKPVVFSEIEVGEKFSIFSIQEFESKTILIKVDEKTYKIEGQERIWKVHNEKMQCYKNQ